MDLSPTFLHKLKKVLLLFYTIFMLWLLFGRNRGGAVENYWEQLDEHMILTPFQTIRSFLRSLQHGSLTQKRLAIVNLVGNVIMFVPLGFFVPILWKRTRKFGWHIMMMALIIFVVELTQLFTLLGTCDVDDLLLNLVGTTMGFCLWKLGLWIENKK